jgi:hypothetical protein
MKTEGIAVNISTKAIIKSSLLDSLRIGDNREPNLMSGV